MPMRLITSWTLSLSFLGLGFAASFGVSVPNSYAQDDILEYEEPAPRSTSSSGSASKSTDPNDESVIALPRDTSEPPVKEFTNAERNKACSKYNGKLVSLSGEMWQVTKCVRHQIHDADEIFRLNRKGTPVVDADARDLASIPVGQSWDAMRNAKQRPCSTFNGRYVTYSFTDIYFVERCVKRMIPDYETLLQHRKDQKARGQEVLELTDAEFYSMKQGRDITSVIDKEFSKLLDGSAGVDIIPVDEACKGVEGKFVSFYSRIYRIEKCRKREIDAEAFTRKYRNQDFRLIELKAEQWLSMPDGKPLATP